MQHLREIVRSQVDEMRSAGLAQAPRQDVVDALRTAVPASTGEPAATQGGPVHVCPWHTCQATRHN